MIKDLKIRVDRRQPDGLHINSEMKPLTEYTDMVSYRLKKIISDVEELASLGEDTPDRDLWSDDTKNLFGRIRHVILNAANDVSRIPQTLYYRNVPCSNMDVSEMLAKLIDHK